MRYFPMIFFVFIASCSTKEEKAERAKKRVEVNEYRIEQSRLRENIEKQCSIAADARLPIKNEKYTAYQQVVADTKTTSVPFCFPPDPISGHSVCDSMTKTKNIYASIPYEATRDGNATKRVSFKEACECKNRIDQYSLTKSTYSDLERIIKVSEKVKFNKRQSCLAVLDRSAKQSWFKRIPVFR